jgi:hypothetical protein
MEVNGLMMMLTEDIGEETPKDLYSEDKDKYFRTSRHRALNL